MFSFLQITNLREKEMKKGSPSCLEDCTEWIYNLFQHYDSAMLTTEERRMGGILNGTS